MNEIYFLLSIVCTFTLLLTFYKFFGRVGLFIWVAISILYANIEVLLMVNLFTMPVTLGNVMYSSTFLATDILSELHSKDDSKKTVYIGFLTMLTVIVVSQIALLFTPNDFDFAFDSFNTIFSLTFRITIASIITYTTSQIFDIHIFHKLKSMTGEKNLWIRNNGSTLVSQLLDTLMFTILAFYGAMPNGELVVMAITTYAIKLLVSLLDTPFIYLAKKIKINTLNI